MKTQTLLEFLKEALPEIQPHAIGADGVTPENVLQHENTELKNVVRKLMDKLMYENSEFRGTENIEAFLQEIKKGRKGIILAEHYSNCDYPILNRLMEKSGAAGKELAERCYAVAGLKIGEANRYISAFAEAFSRIYIYPSRTLDAITDPIVKETEMKRSRAVNIASMRALDKIKNEGHPIVIFPAGTRYRPGKPETKRGVREIDSYIRLFDIMLLISINGNCLRIAEDPEMTMDTVCKDRMILCASKIYNCEEFRDKVKSANPVAKDKKQVVVDEIMAILEKMHNDNEVGRL